MTAAVADREGPVDAVLGLITDQRTFKVAAGVQIFQYTTVSPNAAGWLEPAADDAGQTGNAVFLALQGVDNTTGADGEVKIFCMVRGTARMETGALTQAAVGTVAHVLDDSTLATSSVNTRPIGVVTAWTSTRTEVQIG